MQRVIILNQLSAKFPPFSFFGLNEKAVWHPYRQFDIADGGITRSPYFRTASLSLDHSGIANSLTH
jgi:hypothetical protein